MSITGPGSPPEVPQEDVAQPPADLPDPPAMAQHEPWMSEGKVAWRRARGDLFVNGASRDDPVQGMAGDCYFIASMSALAGASPDAVRNLFRQNPDGTVTVHLHEVDEKGNPTPRDVTVDPDLLMREKFGPEAPQYASSADRDAAGRPELWPSLLEKAYAQLQGGYDKIGQGGNASRALTALTGKKAEDDFVGDHPDESDLVMSQRMAALFKFDPAVTLESVKETRAKHGDAAWKFLKDGVERGSPVVAQTYTDPKALDVGLLPMHAYTVVGVEEKDGRRMVTLRNPAPYVAEMDTPEAEKELRRFDDIRLLDDMLKGRQLGLKSVKWGTFEVPFEEFRKNFVTAHRVPA